MRVEGSLVSRVAIPAERVDVASANRPSADPPVRVPAAGSTPDPVLPPVKVVVSKIDQLTGQPVRLIEASEWNSLDLDSPPRNRETTPPPSPTGGTIGAAGIDLATTYSAPASMTDGSRRLIGVPLAMSSQFAADQRALSDEGRLLATNPLLVSVAPAPSPMRQGTTTFELGLDRNADVARQAIAPARDRSNVDAEASSDRAAMARTLDPAAMQNVAALSAGSAALSRKLIVPTGAAGFRPLEEDRRDAIRLDVVA